MYRLYVLYKSRSGNSLSEINKVRRSDAIKTARKLTDTGCEVVIRDMDKKFSLALKEKIERMQQTANPPFNDEIPF